MKLKPGKLMMRCVALALAFLVAMPPVYVRAEGTGGEDTSHEHVYENGVCTCGAEEPKHEHAYGENGKCACGELDPAHQHAYTEGVCVCGAEEPVHEHAYGENGKCECGVLNPEHVHTYVEGKCVCGDERIIMNSPAPASTEPTGTVSGGILWTLEGGVLTISPAGDHAEDGYESGQMIDYAAGATPWSVSNITSVIVNSGVTKLGARSFFGASGLVSVSLPESLTTISLRAFQDCKSLTTINFPSTLSSLGDFAFPGCVKLQEVDLSDTTITTLGEKCFAGCTALNTLLIPDSVKSIKKDAFGLHGGKTPDSLKILNYEDTVDAWKTLDKNIVESGNTKLKDGTITVSCKNGFWAGGYTSYDQNVWYKLTDGTLTIRCDGAMPNYDQGTAPWYGDAGSITNVVLEAGITSVGANAFYGCKELTCDYADMETLKTNSNLTGNEALFGEEESGGGGEDPDDGGEVDENIITGTTGDVTYSLNKTTGVMTLSGTGATKNFTSAGDFAGDTTWAEVLALVKELVVEEGVTKLGNRLFTKAPELVKVTLPASLVTIGERCFTDCYKLEEVVFSAATGQLGLKTMGQVAFNACTSLKSIDLSRTQLETLPKKAFAACPQLTTISLPKIETIGECCFGATGNNATSSLTTVYFNGSGAEWSNITVSPDGSDKTDTGATQTKNTQLLNCTIICSDGEFTLDENYDVIVTAPDDEPEANLTGGVAWELSEDGKTLTISVATTPADGYDAGKMPDYEEGKAPWAEAASTITTVVFEGDVTYVGSNAFPGETKLSCNYNDEQLNALKEASNPTGNTALFGSEESDDDDTVDEVVEGGVAWDFNEETGVLRIWPAAEPENGFVSGTMRTNYTSKNPSKGTPDPVPWIGFTESITSLVVEEGVTVLCNRVCNGATGLTSVSLPEGLITMGERCFVDCSNLENVTLPDTLDDMGAYAFTGCKKLTVVDLSNTKIKTLGAKAFAGCENLTTLTIPETITGKNDIASNVFCDYGDVDTNKLTRLNFGGTLATWSSFTNRASESNPNLANGTCTVFCSDGIWNAKYTNAGNNLLYKLENGTLTILCNGAMPDYEEGQAPWFERASEITTVVIEDGTTTIGANAFDDCVNLTDVTVGEGVTAVGENAFKDCENLENVHFNGTVSQWKTLEAASGDGNGPLFGITITSGYTGPCGDNATWEYDKDTKTLTISGTGPMWDWNQRTYQNTPWSKFKDELETIKIGYGITATGRYAFCYLNALKNLEFVTNEAGFTTVETIGGYCFCWESQLTTLTLPEGVRFLSGRAFSSVEKLETVYFPSTLESIDMYAFDSKDKVYIKKVVYNGTKEDWERKVYVSTQGDGLDQLASAEWVYLKDYTNYTDVSSDAWYKKAVYYLKDQGMAPESGAFGVGDDATMQWVLDALYIRSGSSGAYVDALDWAKIKNIAPADTSASAGVSLNALADILYRTTLYNGHLADLGDGTVLNWCQIYIPEELAGQSADAELTRAQAASVLAAYLQSTNGSANRYDEMRSEMKEAYETSGGDGKMHILALNHAGKGKVGDSTLILLPGGETMLIDTFRNDGWQNYLKATLDSLGVKKLDYLVLSHGHDDHDYNLSRVINYIYDNGYSVGNYWSAGSTTSDRETAAINLLREKGGVNIQNRLRAGQTLTIGSGDTLVTVDILWPMESGKGYNGSETNDGSLTIKLTYGDSSYLCGGDLFLTAEEDILELYKDNPDILKADVLKTNHHGSYSSNGSAWVGAIDPKALITHSDDTGDSAQCYEYSRDGKAWFTAGRDGGILVTMDGKKNITITTGYDTNLRQNIYACGEKGHIYEGQAWEFDENGHWRRCEGFWLCGAMEPVLAHAGGTATCQSGKICETCGFEYTEKGGHVWGYTADGNVLHADCTLCDATGTLSLEFADTAPVYDGTEKTVTVSGSINGVTTPDVVYEGSRVNAGTFIASIQLGNAKAELDVTIGKRNVTVEANDQTIAYGGTISNTEITATGLLDGHSVSATLTPSTSNVTTNGTITPGAAVITADGTDVTANYNITYVTGKLVIEATTTEAEQKAEAVEAVITKLPATVEPDDEEAAEEILAAKTAYDALTEAEQSLVSEAAKEKLNDLVAALTDYEVIKGDGSKWTEGGDGSLSFTANGPFSKFVGIEVDGKEVDEKYYTAKSGSTIITLKQSYLKKLSTGKHTITVLYNDGETSGTFTVKSEATTPATGDNSGIMLWSAVLLLSVMGMVLLIGNRKRSAYKGKYVRK